MGYDKLRERPYVPLEPTPWQGIWRCPSWPKVDYFSWLLCHSKILTHENLQRKGFHGPLKCSLCEENSESVTHLMLECRFSMQIWFKFLHTLNSNITLPSSTAELFSKWANRYPGPPPKNQVIKAAWSILPKVICWQIWLEWNKRIFRNIEKNLKAIEIKIKCHLKECLIDLKYDSNLSQQDIAWGSFLDLRFQKDVRNAPFPKAWQIRESKKYFQDWIINQTRHSLFFDGEAKGNPGKAGVGGVILNPDGKKTHSFAWGLGHLTSIQAKALALFQGLKLLKALNISESNVFGNS